jgi:DDE superfamily endonuclease
LYYSGKKKQHTVKNMLVIDGDGRICSLSMTYEGKWHDKSIADDSEYQLPAASILYQDMGFQGFAVSGSVMMQPKKKPRGGELTSEEKEENRRINAIRVRIEHVIGSVKRYRIVKDKLRLWRERIHDMVMETCCGLHNFRLHYRPWVYQLCNES